MAKIMLMGDSIMAHFPTNLLGKETDEIINKGIDNIGIDTYILYCLPKLDISDADICILLIGINNILRPDCDYDEKTLIEDISKKLKKIINEINQNNVILLVQSIYPTKLEEVNKIIQIINENIKEFCYQLDVDYLDFYDLLSDKKGFLKDNYTEDGIHPNEEGYNLLANQLNDYIDSYRYRK